MIRRGATDAVQEAERQDRSAGGASPPAHEAKEREMTGTSTLICPTCRGPMRTYERNGVLVDQCEECRGIFLDRGELEQLLDAERSHARPEERKERDDDERGRHDPEDEHGRSRRRTGPSTFLSDLLGGGD